MKYPNGTKAFIKDTRSVLDGQQCTIVGYTSDYVTVFYIIEISDWKSLGLEYPCMQMIESCLDFKV